MCINQAATFIIDLQSVTDATTIETATLSFGTTAGANVPGVADCPPFTVRLTGWTVSAGATPDEFTVNVAMLLAMLPAALLTVTCILAPFSEEVV